MKFKVGRTSQIFNDDESPCKDAIRESYDSKWADTGKDKGWFIEIDSLESLIKFNEEYGKIILRKCWDNENINEIEIYDDYRE